MAKENLLQIVQDILSDADSDAVNSISATVESEQCARVVRTIFNQIQDGTDISYKEGIVELDATSPATPNIMLRPAGFYDIEWVRYNIKVETSDPNKYENIRYQEANEFIDWTSSRSSDDPTIESVTLESGYEMLVRNDAQPTFWTWLEGPDHLIFDAYDRNLDSNLQASKSLAYGKTKPTLALTDLSVPDLPEHLFNQLKFQARALYFDLYKDGATREIDKLSRRSEVRVQRHRHLVKMANVEKQTGQDFGRLRRRGGGRTTGRRQ